MSGNATAAPHVEEPAKRNVGFWPYKSVTPPSIILFVWLWFAASILNACTYCSCWICCCLNPFLTAITITATITKINNAIAIIEKAITVVDFFVSFADSEKASPMSFNPVSKASLNSAWLCFADSACSFMALACSDIAFACASIELCWASKRSCSIWRWAATSAFCSASLLFSRSASICLMSFLIFEFSTFGCFSKFIWTSIKDISS